MIKEQIEAIQAKLQQTENIPASVKVELTQLLAELESEISLLSQTHEAEAREIARSTQVSASETMRGGNQPELVEDALQELRRSVEGFEISHPKMTGIVGQLATTLSNMGI